MEPWVSKRQRKEEGARRPSATAESLSTPFVPTTPRAQTPPHQGPAHVYVMGALIWGIARDPS